MCGMNLLRVYVIQVVSMWDVWCLLFCIVCMMCGVFLHWSVDVCGRCDVMVVVFMVFMFGVLLACVYYEYCMWC